VYAYKRTGSRIVAAIEALNSHIVFGESKIAKKRVLR
jgi:hypothetical protein